MGDSFRRQLYRDGFSQSPVSHPKRGVTGGRGSAKRGF
jgi:hypothetical protein